MFLVLLCCSSLSKPSITIISSASVGCCTQAGTLCIIYTVIPSFTLHHFRPPVVPCATRFWQSGSSLVHLPFGTYSKNKKQLRRHKMYSTLLVFHSLIRWVVLAFLLYSIYRAFVGLV